MRIAKTVSSMVLGCFLLMVSNVAVAYGNANAMRFVDPLPDIPQQMTAGEKVTVDYKLTTVGGWAVNNIISNYEDKQGDIVNLHTCSSLPVNTSCIFSLEIAPKKNRSLSLQLKLSGNDQTIFLNEPRTSTINVVSVKITKDPTSAIVATGGSTMFIVDAIGSPTPLKYQWKLDGKNIQGATSKVYTINNATKYDAGKYTVVVSTNDGSGSITSNEAILQVGDGPIINTQPESKIVATNNPVIFSVAATGLGGLKYQWLKDGAEIQKATSKDYNISKAKKADAGDYQVKVTDDTKLTTISNTAILQVGDGPVINTQPESKIIATNNPVTFSVGAAGLGELKYQWMKDSVEISGATSKDYNISKAKKTDAGGYQVKVTDGTHVTVISNTATLQVGDGPVINTQPESKIIATDNPVTFSVGAAGLGELKYQWLKDGAEISGATSKDYSILQTTKNDAGDYQVKVTDGTHVTVTSNAAALQVGDSPSVIKQPQNQTVLTGTPVTFTVAATGTGTLHYQWYKGVSPIGEDASKFTIESAKSSDIGSYNVKITNYFGKTASNIAVLKVKEVGIWTNTGYLNTERYWHTATLLPNGMVLVVGGLDNMCTVTASAELYDPNTGVWTNTGALHTGRYRHTATLLPNGMVLVVGGLNGNDATLASVEL